MPYSILILDVNQNNISAELKLPLKEMQYAVPFDVTNNLGDLIKIHRHEIEGYILHHLHTESESGQVWKMDIGNMKLDSTQQEATGIYNEIIIDLLLLPPPETSPRNFKLYYDGIVHQVVTHKILVTVRKDFDNGMVGEKETEIGMIYMNPANNQVAPIEINLESGSKWAGTKSMFKLGMQHISEGTDHLLFLLVLLLAAPMVATKNYWTCVGTTKYSIVRLLKIVTAFTIGHSLTLAFAASGIIKLPPQPIEVLIAVSILVTAIHAIKPIFPNKEIYVAAGFGLIHGLAFASVLSNLNLDVERMVLSVLGFNLGIECMQLYIVLLTFPWLLILSNYPTYKWVRIFGGMVGGIASIAWIVERISTHSNAVSILVQYTADHGKYLLLILALFTIANQFIYKLINPPHSI